MKIFALIFALLFSANLVLACAGEEHCEEAKTSISAGFHQDSAPESASHEAQHCLNHCDHRIASLKKLETFSFIEMSEKANFSYRFHLISADLEGPFRPPLA